MMRLMGGIESGNIKSVSEGETMILRETPSERACSVLEDGFRMWPSRVTKLVFITDPTAPIFPATDKL